jgi:Ca2+-binding EF-hand superfamily protein
MILFNLALKYEELHSTLESIKNYFFVFDDDNTIRIIENELKKSIKSLKHILMINSFILFEFQEATIFKYIENVKIFKEPNLLHDF